jgi:iron(III) transport system ATP-binding protein
MPSAQPAPVTGPYLSIRGLSKSFGSFTALRDIGLDVDQGEFVCFLGPSGCGKTTLLRAIAGLVHQDAGEIRQAGRDISRLPVSKRDFGIVFQSYALFPNLTVQANVAYGLEAEGRLDAGARGKRVAELLALVGLSGAERKFPAELSGGEQQRVALARALATSPGLLLLDEPLSALDARVRLRLRAEIKALQRKIDVTTIMVTHDQEEALTMADRIVVMNGGRIEQIGTPFEIYHQPRTAFVADFVGTMNMIEVRSVGGRLRSDDGLTLDCEALAARHAEGDTFTLCMRPEEVRTLPPGAEAANGCDARIRAIEFHGASYMGVLDVPPEGGHTIFAGLNGAAARDLEVGRVIRIALPPDNLLVFAGASRAARESPGGTNDTALPR